MRSILYLFITLLFFNFSQFAFALREDTKFWGDVFINGYLTKDHKLLYLLGNSLRFVDHQDYFELDTAQAGIGYQSTPTLSFWGGYQWDSPNQISGAGNQHRLWEQAIWNLFNKPNIAISSRTRFEERKREGEGQIWNRARQRIRLVFPNQIVENYSPVISDEIFVNLNNPVWVNNQLLDQNRLFLGVDIHTSKHTFLEVGYLNQYQFHSQENIMSNIAYMSLNIMPI